MKKLISILFLSAMIISCGSKNSAKFLTKVEEDKSDASNEEKEIDSVILSLYSSVVISCLDGVQNKLMIERIAQDKVKVTGLEDKPELIFSINPEELENTVLFGEPVSGDSSELEINADKGVLLIKDQYSYKQYSLKECSWSVEAVKQEE